MSKCTRYKDCVTNTLSLASGMENIHSPNSGCSQCMLFSITTPLVLSEERCIRVTDSYTDEVMHTHL